ncbi:hypothetical protein R1flu_026599 [Riccia fluitans]|uniref:Uncharacterized protein n=1 Tax=Riccia fluitans TaxID=41844 RepID=A0ABD1XJB5_9MARC
MKAQSSHLWLTRGNSNSQIIQSSSGTLTSYLSSNESVQGEIEGGNPGNAPTLQDSERVQFCPPVHYQPTLVQIPPAPPSPIVDPFKSKAE